MYNSSYSFIPILLELHRWFGNGLKICMWFGYNHQIIFRHFFHKLNLVVFQELLLSKCIDRGYNFTFKRIPHLTKRILARGHKFSDFACRKLKFYRKILFISPKIENGTHPNDMDGKSHLSRFMRKPTFCICENKDADQLCGNREADQRLFSLHRYSNPSTF